MNEHFPSELHILHSTIPVRVETRAGPTSSRRLGQASKLTLISVTLSLSACTGSQSTDVSQSPANDTPLSGEVANSPADETLLNDGVADTPAGDMYADQTGLEDVASLYEEDGYGEVDVVQLNVRTQTTPGTCEIDDYSGCTLDDVMADTQHNDAYNVDIPIHFVADGYPEDGMFTNAELRQRGGSTRQAPQKSFRIKLDDKDALWRGERKLQLNKHPYEASRIRNKLAFDLMSEIPHLLSFRTQFVNLWIDDGQSPEDYGLFTHVEAPDEFYLAKRGLGENDRLYKVANFRFRHYDLANVQTDHQGKPIDENRFEQSLEIKNGRDHRPLVEMMSAVLDYDRPFESVLDQYFDRANVLTWIATNILLHQTDAISHNFILYNSENSERFHFLPWDYDGCFVLEIEPANTLANADLQRRLSYGYARGINNEFITRLYRLPGIHDELVATAQSLRNNYLTDANINARVNLSESVVQSYLEQSPDIDHNVNYVSNSGASFAASVGGNLEALKTRFGIPLPPDMKDPELIDDQWLFSWEPAYDVMGSTISYELLLSSTVGFEPDNLVFNISGIADPGGLVEQTIDASRITPGVYYTRVIARASNDPSRYWQVSRNTETLNGETHFGTMKFVVP